MERAERISVIRELLIERFLQEGVEEGLSAGCACKRVINGPCRRLWLDGGLVVECECKRLDKIAEWLERGSDAITDVLVQYWKQIAVDASQVFDSAANAGMSLSRVRGKAMNTIADTADEEIPF